MIDAKKAVSELLKKGAAIVVQPGGLAMAVGDMREVEPGVWWWWEAGCESEFGGHVIIGEPEVFHGGLGVKWISDKCYGYLTTIEEAVDEPGDQKRLRAILAVWRATYESSKNLRGFIKREMKRHLASKR